MQRLFELNDYLSQETKAELAKTQQQSPEADDADIDETHADDPAYEFDYASESYRPRVLRFLYGSTAIGKDATTAHLIRRGAVGILNGCIFDKAGTFVAFASEMTGAECPLCAYRPQILSSVLVLRCARGHYFSVPQATPGSFAMPMQRVK